MQGYDSFPQKCMYNLSWPFNSRSLSTIASSNCKRPLDRLSVPVFWLDEVGHILGFFMVVMIAVVSTMVVTVTVVIIM